MTTIEDRVRRLGGVAVPAELPDLDDLVRRGELRRRRQRLAEVVVAVAVLGAGVTGVYGLVGNGGDTVETLDAPATDEIELPDVLGLEVAAAKADLERRGLVVEVTPASNLHADDGGATDIGPVLAQEPFAFTALRPGDTVWLTAGYRYQPLDGLVISGLLLDGRVWTVGNDRVHGLCATLGPVDLGCDDVGPVIGPDADPATPRVGLDVDAESFIDGDLVYGFLPPDATSVKLRYDDGREVDEGLVVEPNDRFWGVPVDPADNPDWVVYRDDDGVEVGRFPLSPPEGVR